MNNNGRPDAAPAIYKNGRSKSRKELNEMTGVSDKPEVRFKLSWGSCDLSFSAPLPANDTELADLLIDAANGLKAPRKKVVAECDSCFKFILDGEVVNHVEQDNFCNECFSK